MGKQVFHSYPESTLPNIACHICLLHVSGKFLVCRNALVFQQLDDSPNLSIKRFKLREYVLEDLFRGSMFIVNLLVNQPLEFRLGALVFR